MKFINRKFQEKEHNVIFVLEAMSEIIWKGQCHEFPLNKKNGIFGS